MKVCILWEELGQFQIGKGGSCMYCTVGQILQSNLGNKNHYEISKFWADSYFAAEDTFPSRRAPKATVKMAGLSRLVKLKILVKLG